ncbi:unnamed protein product [Brassica rapa]|nr:unnamed protein product [Brassica napus]CAG7875031.1 unnamed protein product [Brassica rapa]
MTKLAIIILCTWRPYLHKEIQVPYQNTAGSWNMMAYALLGGQYRNTDPPAMFML